MRRRSFATVIGLAVVIGPSAGVPASPPESGGRAGASNPGGSKAAATETAVFGGGCFWSLEAVFERAPGVKAVVSGFSGGTVPYPSYEAVCTGRTGHAEAVWIEYDPSVVSFKRLLNLFWRAHDPTTWNRQGDDFGPQYRSVVFYRNNAQKQAVLESYEGLVKRRAFGAPIVTELVPFQAFFPAELRHQNYYRNHPYSDYSLTYIVPKLRKLKPAR